MKVRLLIGAAKGQVVEYPQSHAWRLLNARMAELPGDEPGPDMLVESAELVTPDTVENAAVKPKRKRRRGK